MTTPATSASGSWVWASKHREQRGEDAFHRVLPRGERMLLLAGSRLVVRSRNKGFVSMTKRFFASFSCFFSADCYRECMP